MASLSIKFCFPSAGRQGGGGAAHGHIQHTGRVYLTHGTAVVGQHRQEADKFLDLEQADMLLVRILIGIDFRICLQTELKDVTHLVID